MRAKFRCSMCAILRAGGGRGSHKARRKRRRVGLRGSNRRIVGVVLVLEEEGNRRLGVRANTVPHPFLDNFAVPAGGKGL